MKLYSRLKGVRGRVMFACLFVLASTLSGGLSIAREVISDYQLFSAEEVLAAEYIEDNLPSDAVILTGDQHNNAVAALTGRDIVCGTGSYLYFHGIDYSLQRSDMAAMLANPAANLEAFGGYGIDYIYISNHEIYNYAADENWFADNCQLVFGNSSARIYAWNPDLSQNMTSP